jgi:hypothetical protein
MNSIAVPELGFAIAMEDKIKSTKTPSSNLMFISILSLLDGSSNALDNISSKV